MSSDETVIRVANLGKSYHIYRRPEDRLKQYLFPRLPLSGRLRRASYAIQFSALSDVSFEVARGETVGIIGRNGSGKSTLLQLICGTLSPTTGTIEVQGRVGALLELGAGFNPEFSGVENVYLAAALHGLKRSEIDRRIDAIAAFAEIGDYFERPVKTYSSGMYLRLAFALIAHIDADVLVIDEALAVGDAFFVQKCMRFLRSFIDRGTLLFVSHDLGAIMNLCNRAILLDRGRMEMAGEPKEVVERYLAQLCEPREETTAPLLSHEGNVDGAPSNGNGSAIRANYSSHVQVFGFRPESSGFGTGQAQIVSVSLQNGSGRDMTSLMAGDLVNLRVVCYAATSIVRPIIGFQLKDRLGQVVFGDNTFLSYQYDAPEVGAGGELEANFSFRMPCLPSGDYTFAVAIAEGTQDVHIQHHWLHDALMIRADATSQIFGLVGIPMTRITLEAR